MGVKISFGSLTPAELGVNEPVARGQHRGYRRAILALSRRHF